MSRRVFSWDTNPAVDSFSFRLSDARAFDLLTAARAFEVICKDGVLAIQLAPPLEVRELTVSAEGKPVFERISTNFRDAWQQRPSGIIPVWQMTT